MLSAAKLLGLVLVLGNLAGPLAGQDRWTSSNLTSPNSYSTVHHLPSAHEFTLGKGAKVAILDHSFGLDAHPELYAGFEDFQRRESKTEEAEPTFHGYWMALALREVAPEAEIFALNTFSPNEMERVAAVVEGLEWAMKNHLDAATYCGAEFSPQARVILDPAVERAVEAGVVVVFLNYDHPLNILPVATNFGAGSGAREPDLNIFSGNCTLVLGHMTVGLLDAGDSDLVRRRPFLSQASAAPVAAGLVALVRSLDPTTSPARVKEILKTTSRSLRVDGAEVAHVPDAFRAVKRVVGIPTFMPVD